VRTTVAGVLLAAGEGSRFGQPKALVEFSGQTLADEVARRHGEERAAAGAEARAAEARATEAGGAGE